MIFLTEGGLGNFSEQRYVMEEFSIRFVPLMKTNRKRMNELYLPTEFISVKQLLLYRKAVLKLIQVIQ